MEDRVASVLDIDGKDVSIVGLFDGHGGSGAAEYAAVHCLKALHSIAPCMSARNIHGAICQLDEQMLTSRKKTKIGNSGCTACCVAIYPPDADGKRDCWLINIGDSRCYLGHKEGTVRQLSVDHSPSDPIEAGRIASSGGVVKGGRVWGAPGESTGGLNLTRSLGDSQDKQRDVPPELRRICCMPQVKRFTVEPGDTVFLMSDGMYEGDLLNETVSVLREVHRHGTPAASRHVDRAVRQQMCRSSDNITLAAIYMPKPDTDMESPRCSLVVPPIEGVKTPYGMIAVDPATVLKDCALFGAPYCGTLVVGDVYDADCPAPGFDEQNRSWYTPDNHIRMSEAAFLLHDAAFHAKTVKECESLCHEEKEDELCVCDMWGNTPLHYLAMRMRLIEEVAASGSALAKAIAGDAGTKNRLGFKVSSYDTYATCLTSSSPFLDLGDDGDFVLHIQRPPIQYTWFPFIGF